MIPPPRPLARTARTARTARGAAAALGVAALLAVGACGGNDGSDAGTGTADTAVPGLSPPVTAPPSEGSAGASLAEESQDGREVVEVDIAVTGGQVQGPGDRVDVPLGGSVRLTVTSDTADEAHVHGYDHTLDLTPGAPAAIEFPAEIPGVFEVELHGSGRRLVSLEVS